MLLNYKYLHCGSLSMRRNFHAGSYSQPLLEKSKSEPTNSSVTVMYPRTEDYPGRNTPSVPRIGGGRIPWSEAHWNRTCPSVGPGADQFDRRGRGSAGVGG
jgi:hypothetical protein